MAFQKSKWFKPAVLATVLATAGGIGVAAANSGGWGHGDRGYGACHGERHGGRMGGMFGPGRHVDGKLAFLKAELKITGDQETAWQAFADVVRSHEEARAERWQAHSDRRGERRERMKGDDGGYDAPALNERIDRGITFMEQRLADMKEMGEAAKTLYGALTADQQKIADRLMSRRHGGRFMF